MSAPVSPSAFTPKACSPATTCLLTSPPYTIVTTRSMSASVMRRPFTMRLSMPRRAARAVAERPPPCTSTLCPAICAKSARSCRNEASSSTILPPTLISVSWSIQLCYELQATSYKLQATSGLRPSYFLPLFIGRCPMLNATRPLALDVSFFPFSFHPFTLPLPIFSSALPRRRFRGWRLRV